MKFAEPRYTKDLNLWIDRTPQNAARLFGALAKAHSAQVGGR
jgi:hypothetical protein